MTEIRWRGWGGCETVPGLTSSDVWTVEQARRYDGEGGKFSPEVLAPTIDALVALANGARALELAVGTGRVAVPLRARGVPVSGIELSAAMVEQLRTKATPDEIPVTIGDMATTQIKGEFSLVYLVYNTIGNLCTQREQVECFRNAARHLLPGGRFLVEVGVPSLRRLPPGQAAVPFDVSDEHLGFDTYDLVNQQAISHHFTQQEDGTYRRGRHNYRFAWPSELDLMAQLAGMTLEHRVQDWTGTPFTSRSEGHVSVWRLAP